MASVEIRRADRAACGLWYVGSLVERARAAEIRTVWKEVLSIEQHSLFLHQLLGRAKSRYLLCNSTTRYLNVRVCKSPNSSRYQNPRFWPCHRVSLNPGRLPRFQPKVFSEHRSLPGWTVIPASSVWCRTSAPLRCMYIYMWDIHRRCTEVVCLGSYTVPKFSMFCP